MAFPHRRPNIGALRFLRAGMTEEDYFSSFPRRRESRRADATA